MGPEESTPLTEQEKIRLQGSAGSSATGATTSATVEAATAVDEAVAAEPEAEVEPQPAEASSAAADEPMEDESKSDLELLEGFDVDEEEGETGDDGESPAAMGIAAEAPADALTSGKGFVYPAEGTHECPEDYPIKGNASSRIYHRPGESSYDATIPEICFASDTAANAAGYRERKR
jgi:large subunit ribosomal protein L17